MKKDYAVFETYKTNFIHIMIHYYFYSCSTVFAYSVKVALSLGVAVEEEFSDSLKFAGMGLELDELFAD